MSEEEEAERGTGHFDNSALDECLLSEQVGRWLQLGRIQIHQLVDMLIKADDKFLKAVAQNLDHLMYEYDRLAQASENGHFPLDKYDPVSPATGNAKHWEKHGYL